MPATFAWASVFTLLALSVFSFPSHGGCDIQESRPGETQLHIQTLAIIKEEEEKPSGAG